MVLVRWYDCYGIVYHLHIISIPTPSKSDVGFPSIQFSLYLKKVSTTYVIEDICTYYLRLAYRHIREIDKDVDN